MSQHTDPFGPAIHTSRIWLRTVADRLGTDDPMTAMHLLRAWLHTTRDRLDIGAAAHLSAQLPTLLRGVYYEGWTPGRVPVPHDPQSFLHQFAHIANVPVDQAGQSAAAVTDALAQLLSPGTLDHVLAQLPAPLRRILLGADFSGILSAAGIFETPEGR
ncbi:DUF2267 domain-containing protein [Nocardia sp. ET3-3]|uniref:DUF2267 domain-containing protein n=1 Tax=Nocardia terrae TaxID=2675851 RepID=A0A7K1UVB6_9NOCA|nr:DUF2267 domain-containing protein [Nocardia terrae]MVU78304.1 DUF2267 domain-containing protein [Nocardia terrae]